MKFEIGKEYLFNDQKVKLIYIGRRGADNLLVVYSYKGRDVVVWLSTEDLKELSPYHDFKRGEPVIALHFSGRSYRRYFSHVGDNGRPFCFCDTGTAWSSGGKTSAWGLIRKLTPEEREEYDKCL